MSFVIVLLFINLNTLMYRCQEMEGFVVHGKEAAIESFPHSVFLTIRCAVTHGVIKYSCGASIVNQAVCLTAGHCLGECNKSFKIVASAGDADHRGGYKSTVTAFLTHERYETSPTNDIALMALKTPFTLGPKTSRVALMKSPPRVATAYVAGWGLVNENPSQGTDVLQYTSQSLIERSKCEQIIGRIPKGCLCAGDINGKSWAAVGDSGSALIIQKYIQIGIVSYKIPSRSNSVIVYTDVAYYHDWIEKNIKNVTCKVNK